MKHTYLLSALLAASTATTTEGANLTRLKGYFPPDVKTIGLITPGSCPNPKSVKRGIALLEAAGYKVKIMTHALDPATPETRIPAPDDPLVKVGNGYYPYFQNSLEPEKRLADFYQAWDDPEIDLILATRGGLGCRDLIAAFDWDRLAKRPGLRIMGFSDCTLLGLAFTAKNIGHPILGPVCTTLASLPQANIDYSADMLNGRATAPLKLTPVVPGDFSGLPLAGVLSRFVYIGKTDLKPDGHGRVFFLETIDCKPKTWQHDLDECLRLHVFDGAAGIVLCHFPNCGTPEEVFDGMKNLAERVHCPLYMGFEFGHLPNNNAIDLTRPCVMKDGILTFPAVK